MSGSETNSDDSSDTSSSSESDVDCGADDITSAMFTMTLIPLRTDLSDHTSDEEIYEGKSSDEAESDYCDAESELNCSCGLCPSDGTGFYCCHEVSVVV